MKPFNLLLLFELAVVLGVVAGWLLFGPRPARNAPTAQAEALMAWADDGGAGGG